MKKLVLIFVLVAMGLLFIAAVPALNNYFENPLKSSTTKISGVLLPDKTYQKEFNVKPGGKLTLDLETGCSIEIEGWSKNVVSADVTIKGRDAENVTFEFEQMGDNVTVTSDYIDDKDDNNASVKIVVKVPQKYSIDFSTMGGGVTINSVEGELEGKTMGGELNLTGLKGKVNMETMGGGIEIKNCEIDGKVHTMGGSIEMDNVVGDLNASTMGGSIKQNNVKSKSGSVGDEVNISTMGGDIDFDEAMNGAKVKTMGGSITVNKAAKFVDVETMGGSIEIKSVDGWVKAKTMGGDVEVKMVGDPNQGDRSVRLTSMGGDIFLTVPSGLSMDVDIEIAYTKKHEDVKIESDFQLNEERTKDWDDSRGSKRKYLYGKGTINGGKNKVVIRTINGDVYLKKG